MLENSNCGMRQSTTKNQRGMIQCVAENKTTFANQTGDNHGVRCETHRTTVHILHSDVFGNQFFQLLMHDKCPCKISNAKFQLQYIYINSQQSVQVIKV